MTLPGGFQLPLALVIETGVTHAVDTTVLSEKHNASVLCDFANHYLQQNTVAGEIIGCEEHLERLKATDCLRGTYMCREMIGRVRIEETIEQNGKTN